MASGAAGPRRPHASRARPPPRPPSPASRVSTSSSASFGGVRGEQRQLWSLASPEAAWRSYDDEQLYQNCHTERQERTWDVDPHGRAAEAKTIPIDTFVERGRRSPPWEPRRRRRSVERLPKMPEVEDERPRPRDAAVSPARSRRWSAGAFARPAGRAPHRGLRPAARHGPREEERGGEPEAGEPLPPPDLAGPSLLPGGRASKRGVGASSSSAACPPAERRRGAAAGTGTGRGGGGGRRGGDLPRVVGDNDFCVGDAMTVRDAKQEMHPAFCPFLLESVLVQLLSPCRTISSYVTINAMILILNYICYE